MALQPLTKKVLEEQSKRSAERKSSMSTGLSFFLDECGMSELRVENAALSGDKAAAQKLKKIRKNKDIFFDADYILAEGPEEKIPDKNWDGKFNVEE